MKSFASLSLRSRLALCSIAIVLAVMVALGTWSGLQLRRDIRANAAATQATLVQQVGQEIDEKLELRVQAIKLAAAVVPGDALHDAARMRAHLDGSPVLSSLFDAVFVVDAQGRLVADAPEAPSRAGMTLADRSYFQTLMKTGSSVISEPVKNKTTGDPTLVLGTPIRDAKSNVVGALLGSIVLTNKNFLGDLRNAKVGQTGYFYIVSKGPSPLVIVHPDAHRLMTPVSAPERNPLVHRALGGFEGTLEGRNTSGLEALFTYQQLRSVPWVLSSVYPTSEAYAPLRDRLIDAALFAAAVALLAGLAMWKVADRLLWPLRILRQHMLMAASGQDEEVPATTRAEEFVQVRTAYNRLRQHKLDAEAALREAERRVRAIADHMSAQVVHVDAQERVTFVNAHVGRFYGRDAASFIGMSLRELHGEEAYREMAPQIHEALSGQAVSFEHDELVQGGRVHLRSAYRPDFAADGSVRGFYGVTHDITDLHAVQARAKHSEDQVRRILEHAADAFVSLDPQGRITEWNRAAEETFGWARDEVLGRALDEVIIPEAQREAHRRGWARFAKSGAGPVVGQRLEVPALHRTGREIPVELSIVAQRQGDGWIANAFLRDIGDRKAAERHLKANERRLRAITDHVPAFITLVDRDGRLKAVNEPLAKALRMPASVLEGRPLREVVGERLYTVAEPYIARALQGEEVTFEASVRMRDGEHDLLEHYVPERDEDGSVTGFYTMALDITERKKAERRIAGSERRMRTIADNLPVLIAYIGADRRYQLCNRTYTDWFGRPASELEGVHHDDLSPSPARRHAVTEALKGNRTEMDEEWTFLTGTRHVHSVYIPDIEPDGTVRGLHGLTTDVTATKLNELRLANLARHDALTGLPNRRHFEETLHDAIARAKRSGKPMALLFLDIDFFKQINDTHGHEAGDEVLQAFANRLRSSVRSTDTVSRLAGDEFTVILEGLTAEPEAETVARKITEAIRPLVTLKNRVEVRMSSSIGVAVFNGESGDPESIVGTADRALYAAKEAGRATWRTLKVV